ncbi:MAG: hypothetical protein EP330_05325 [Deltaproteobacteria bacterium]|nr:MAG: hypothetical protein EP330_05325 [Deltaproteobacteria bacterium]
MEVFLAKIGMGFAIALVMGGGAWLVTSRRSAARIAAEGGAVDPAAWRGWAESSGYSFTGNDARPAVAGDHNGVPFRMSCEIRTIRVQTRGVSREHKIARTQIRVSMRTGLPEDLFIHPMPRFARFLNRLFGGNAVPLFDALDVTHATETSQPERAREILTDPRVLPHLGRVVTLVPEAIIDARSVEVTFSGMPTLAMALDRYVETLADFARAVQEVAPGAAIEAKVADPTVPEEEAAKPILSSAQLPKRRPILQHALGKVMRNPGEIGMLSVQPFEYLVEVHLNKTGVDERGRETGGRMVCGDVPRSVWRIELLFDPEDTEAVEALPFGSHIEGMLEVLDVDVRRKRVLAKSMTPPMLSTNPPSQG